MKQIILITDGNSNTGVSPAAAAAQAYALGVVVNVIGIVDRETEGAPGAREVEEIARSGGGVHRFVSAEKLAYTMQMMTRHTVMATIQQVVNQELKKIFGPAETRLTSVDPGKRAQLVRSMDEWAETAPIQVALLIDASASMKNKFDAVRESAVDLLVSMQARAGKSELCVFHFPGNTSNVVEMDAGWTAEVDKIRNILYKINVKGTTPTGPAILRALNYLCGEQELEREGAKEALWGDYVV